MGYTFFTFSIKFYFAFYDQQWDTPILHKSCFFFLSFKCKQSITKSCKIFEGLWHSLFVAFYCINHYNHNLSVIQQLHILNHISRQYQIFFWASMHLHYFKNRAIYAQFSFYPQALIMMYRVLTEMTLECLACVSLHHS